MTANTDITPEASDTGAGPKHVAIIMDGNGRWATRRGLPRLAGHRAGVDRVREVVKACPDLGIRTLTLFAFSTENWKRSPEEVAGLMSLFRRYMTKESARLVSEGVRLRFLGQRTRLPSDIQNMIEGIEAQSAGNNRFFLNIALNYGARDEITIPLVSLTPVCSSGRPASCAFRISCCGRPPIPSWFLWMNAGPISQAMRLPVWSQTSPHANADLARPQFKHGQNGQSLV